MQDRPERRRAPRSRTLETARITFNQCSAVIDCMVRNLAADGACVQVTSTAGIPEHFDLSIGEAEPRPCKVAWRTADRLGVAFLDDVVVA